MALHRWAARSAPGIMKRHHARRGSVGDGQATHAARNYMHSILLVIPKPEKDKPGTEQAWTSVVPGLQQQATQAKGVITLYENCWLIPAEENGLSFFDHAITVADGAKLHCRICLLSKPHNGFVHRSSNPRLKRPGAATGRTFQGAARLLGFTN
ncbi:MAG: hypothetical protein ACLP2Y_11225 [Limisphaerales bacterium]